MPDGLGDVPDSAGGPPFETRSIDPQSVLLALAAVTVIVAIVSVVRTSTAFVLLLVGALFAFALDPVVDRIQTGLRIGRGLAVGVVVGIGLLLAALFVFLAGPATVDQAQSFQDDLPRVLDELGSVPLIGGWLEENDVPERIRQTLADLPREIAGNLSTIADAAEATAIALLDATAVALVTLALLIDGPFLVEGAQRLVRPRRRVTLNRLGNIVGQVVGRYFAGSLLLALLQGMQVLLTGLALGVPLSPLLATWAAVWNLIPQIGGAVGGITFVIVALTQGVTTALIAGAVFMVYLTFANNVLLPVVVGRAVDISALSTMAATIVGFTVGGIVGAMVAVPLVGAGKAMVVELRHPGATRARAVEPHVPGPAKRLWARVRRAPAHG